MNEPPDLTPTGEAHGVDGETEAPRQSGGWMADLAAAAGDGLHDDSAEQVFTPDTLLAAVAYRAEPGTAPGMSDPLERAYTAHREVEEKRVTDEDVAGSTATGDRFAFCGPTDPRHASGEMTVQSMDIDDPLDRACTAHREVKEERVTDDDAAGSTATGERSVFSRPTGPRHASGEMTVQTMGIDGKPADECRSGATGKRSASPAAESPGGEKLQRTSRVASQTDLFGDSDIEPPSNAWTDSSASSPREMPLLERLEYYADTFPGTPSLLQVYGTIKTSITTFEDAEDQDILRTPCVPDAWLWVDGDPWSYVTVLPHAAEEGQVLCDWMFAMLHRHYKDMEPTVMIKHCLGFVGNALHILHGNGGGKGGAKGNKGSGQAPQDASAPADYHGQNHGYSAPPPYWQRGQEAALRARVAELEQKDKDEKDRKSMKEAIDDRLARAFSIMTGNGRSEKKDKKHKDSDDRGEKPKGIAGRFRDGLRRLLRRRSSAPTASESSEAGSDHSQRKAKKSKKKRKRSRSTSPSSSSTRPRAHSGAKKARKDTGTKGKKASGSKPASAEQQGDHAGEKDAATELMKAMMTAQATAAARQEAILMRALSSPGASSSSAGLPGLAMPFTPGPALPAQPFPPMPNSWAEMGGAPAGSAANADLAMPFAGMPAGSDGSRAAQIAPGTMRAISNEMATQCEESEARRQLAQALGMGPSTRTEGEAFCTNVASKKTRTTLMGVLGMGTEELTVLEAEDITKGALVLRLIMEIKAGRLALHGTDGA